MKIQRAPTEYRDPILESYSQPNESLSIYQHLENLDLLISVEHCHHCDKHPVTVWHQTDEYYQHTNETFRNLIEVLYSYVPCAKVGLIKFLADITPASASGPGSGPSSSSTNNNNNHNTTTSPPKSNIILNDKSTNGSRIGAFEVQIAYKDHHNKLKVALLHSKLKSKKWPSKSVIEKRLLTFLSSNGVQALPKQLIPSYVFSPSQQSNYHPEETNFGDDGIESYPIGLIPWNLMKISSSTWKYPLTYDNVTIRTSNPNILWLFDTKSYAHYPKFSIGTLIKVYYVPNKYGYNEKYSCIGTVKNSFQDISTNENMITVKLKYLETDINISSENCISFNEVDEHSAPINIEYFTFLTSYFTSQQSLLSLNSVLSSTSYSTITPQVSTSPNSIPYVLFILFNLSIYLSPPSSSNNHNNSHNNSHNNHYLQSNIKWKTLSSDDHAVSRKNGEGDDIYLSRSSFYCKIYELVWW